MGLGDVDFRPVADQDPVTGRLLPVLAGAARRAIRDALGVDAEPDVAPAKDARFGHYQINGVLPLAKQLRDNPRALAAKVVEALDLGGMCLEPEIAGPGFINLRLDPAWVGRELGRVAVDERLGVAPVARAETIVIDFSSPNVAKRMHVGHLRSTIIGDALVRILRHLGHEVVGDNHVGDWGTQFGTLLWAWACEGDEAALAEDPVGELERLYRLGSEAGRADDAVAEACRAELAALQQGDPDRRALWERFVAISRRDAEQTYERLGVTFEAWHGESFYHDQLPAVVSDLMDAGLARKSEGAIAVFFDDDEALQDKPFLIRKSDGAYLYATTDLATLRHRMATYSPSRIIYVVDVRQSLHFRQLFETFRRTGQDVDLVHVGFGMMLGTDGRPFRTRDGGTVALASLLDEAEARILPMVQEKWPDVGEEEQRAIATSVGIGAVKYADLSPNLTTDYQFDWDKLLAADGNTGPYLQYSLVRIRSVLREYQQRSGEAFQADGSPLELGKDLEFDLALDILQLGDALDRTGAQLRPHILCEYAYGLARKFSLFYAKCPILGAPDEASKRARMTLCVATGKALETAFYCLNLPMVERM